MPWMSNLLNVTSIINRGLPTQVFLEIQQVLKSISFFFSYHITHIINLERKPFLKPKVCSVGSVP